jgi:hypothetical protein
MRTSSSLEVQLSPSSIYDLLMISPASCAGTQLANQLVPNLPGTHRILLIDALGFSFYTIASLRAAVVPGKIPTLVHKGPELMKSFRMGETGYRSAEEGACVCGGFSTRIDRAE